MFLLPHMLTLEVAVALCATLAFLIRKIDQFFSLVPAFNKMANYISSKSKSDF